MVKVIDITYKYETISENREIKLPLFTVTERKQKCNVTKQNKKEKVHIAIHYDL